MALDLRGQDLFDKHNLFKISPEDGQGLIFSGNRQIPEEIPGIANTNSDNFNDASLDTSKWTSTLTGSGAVSLASGIATLTTGATNGSSAQIVSKFSIPNASSDEITVNMKFRFNKSIASGGVFKIGVQTAGDTNHIIIWADDNELADNLLEEINHDGGTDSGDIAGAYDNVWFTGKIRFRPPNGFIYNVNSGADYFVDGLTLTGDFYLYAKVTNAVAAAQTIEIDYIEITAV